MGIYMRMLKKKGAAETGSCCWHLMDSRFRCGNDRVCQGLGPDKIHHHQPRKQMEKNPIIGVLGGQIFLF